MANSLQCFLPIAFSMCLIQTIRVNRIYYRRPILIFYSSVPIFPGIFVLFQFLILLIITHLVQIEKGGHSRPAIFFIPALDNPRFHSPALKALGHIRHKTLHSCLHLPNSIHPASQDHFPFVHTCCKGFAFSSAQNFSEAEPVSVSSAAYLRISPVLVNLA